MKAIVQHRYGPPDVLAPEEIDKPVVGEKDVLIRVHAAGLNLADGVIVRGVPYVARLGAELRRPRHGVRGTDVAGTVTERGSTSSWTTSPIIRCRTACVRSRRRGSSYPTRTRPAGGSAAWAGTTGGGDGTVRAPTDPLTPCGREPALSARPHRAHRIREDHTSDRPDVPAHR